MYKCTYLAEGEQVIQQTNIKYEDIFSSDVQKQELIKNIFFVNYQKRAKYLPSNRQEGPEAPQGDQPSGSRETRRKIIKNTNKTS